MMLPKELETTFPTLAAAGIAIARTTTQRRIGRQGWRVILRPNQAKNTPIPFGLPSERLMSAMPRTLERSESKEYRTVGYLACL